MIITYPGGVSISRPAEKTPADWAGLESTGMPHRILIIDDEDDIREVAAMSLETVAGWEVMVANSGAQGLTRAATYKPDAILLDVMMPGHGWAHHVSRTAKESCHSEDSGSVSHSQGAGHRSRGGLPISGIQAVLVKPFDPLTLSDADCERAGLGVTTGLWDHPTTSVAEAMNRLWAQYLPQIEERVATLGIDRRSISRTGR